MDYSEGRAKSLSELVADSRHGRAPRVVVDALAALLYGKEPRSVITSARYEDGSVHWYVTATTEHNLIRVEASREGNIWSLDDGDDGLEPADKFDAWAKPLSAVTAVRLTKVVSYNSAGVSGFYASYELEVSGSVVRLDQSDRKNVEAHEALVAILISEEHVH